MQFDLFAGRYMLLELTGRNNVFTTYLGRDVHMKNRIVVIKVLSDRYSDPKFVARFQREAKVVSALQHPNVLQVYDYGQIDDNYYDGNYYIVMELVEGTDLRRYLRGRGVLDINRAIIIAHDVCTWIGCCSSARNCPLRCQAAEHPGGS